MIAKLRWPAYDRLCESVETKGLWRLLPELFFCEIEIVPVVLSLPRRAVGHKCLDAQGVLVVGVDRDTWHRVAPLYSKTWRRNASEQHVKRGDRGFVLVKNDEILAGVWYGTGGATVEEHLKMLGRDLGSTDIYLFDLFAKPDANGKSWAVEMLAAALDVLAQRGFTRAYGFYQGRNLGARWVHRVLRFEELPRLVMRRYLMLAKFVRPKRPLRA